MKYLSFGLNHTLKWHTAALTIVSHTHRKSKTEITWPDKWLSHWTASSNRWISLQFELKLWLSCSRNSWVLVGSAAVRHSEKKRAEIGFHKLLGLLRLKTWLELVRVLSVLVCVKGRVVLNKTQHDTVIYFIRNSLVSLHHVIRFYHYHQTFFFSKRFLSSFTYFSSFTLHTSWLCSVLWMCICAWVSKGLHSVSYH